MMGEGQAGGRVDKYPGFIYGGNCMELEIVYLSPDELTPYEGNARRHAPDDIEQIKESIAADGFNDPIGIWGEDNIIVEGHGRQIAAKEMGLKLVPCIRLDHLTDTQRRDYAIRHNRTTELSNWDFSKLEEEIAQLEIEGVDLSGLKFDLDAMNDDRGQKTDIVEDEPPEPPETPITHLGDIWQLGQHRLMCGDSTDVNAIDRLMNGAKADMVFCDAPYGYKYESNHQHKYEMLQNDDKILDFIPAIWGAMKDNCHVYEFCGWQSLKQWLEYFENTSLDLKNVIIWKKNNWSMGDLKGAYAGQYEVILYLHKGRVELNGARDTDIWEFDRQPPKMHPTMKPIELIAYALSKSTKKDDAVLDCFGGSGSTLIACEQSNRICYMMELDPHYCDVIIQRWENLTGEKAVLLNA